MKAKVTLKEGLRYYRIDGSFCDLKNGDIVDTDDIPPFTLEDRIRDKHLEPIQDKAAAAAQVKSDKADAAAQAKADRAEERADARADAKADRLAEDRAAVKAGVKR
jgi:hypothetical protein